MIKKVVDNTASRAQPHVVFQIAAFLRDAVGGPAPDLRGEVAARWPGVPPASVGAAVKIAAALARAAGYRDHAEAEELHAVGLAVEAGIEEAEIAAFFGVAPSEGGRR